MRHKFLDKLQDIKNTKKMNGDSSKVFTMAMLAEKMDINPEWEAVQSKTPLIEVLKKRIDAFKLPIKFTVNGALAAEALTGNPGKMIVLLIDCLHVYSGKTVTAKMIADLYPWGFYRDEVFEDYLDNYVKQHQVRFSEIY